MLSMIVLVSFLTVSPISSSDGIGLSSLRSISMGKDAFRFKDSYSSTLIMKGRFIRTN